MHARTLASRITWIVAGAVLAVAPAWAQPNPKRYTLDEWMTVTSVGSFAWSPDGAAIYFTSDAGDSGTDEIFRVPIAGGPSEQLSTNPPGVRPDPKANMQLSSDGKFLVYTSSRYFQNIDNIFRMPATGGAATALTFNDAIIETAPAISPDGRTLAYFSRTGRGVKILLLDLTTSPAWPRLFDPGPKFERDPVWSPDGSLLAFNREGDMWIRSVAGGEARRVVEDAHAGGNGSPAWSPDGTRMAFTTSKSGFSQVGVIEVATGKVTVVTYEPREHADVAWSPDGTSLVFVRGDGMSRDVVVAPASGKRPHTMLTSGKGVRSSPQFSPDGRTVAYIETTGNRTADVWMTPAAGGPPRQVTNSMGKINPADLSVPEEVTYPGPDNLPIPAMLYKPKNFDPTRKYPVVVQLHGHPGQWNHSMVMMWQYFIQQGFVFIAPNPRGSVGFGQGFHDLHVGDYGGTEYEDCIRVLDYLGKLPYIDMTRKATWGGSGGGFMSFVIATKSPGVFQAQVIRAPVSSWKWLAMERYMSPARFATPSREPQRAREEFGGAYTDIPELYDERSPLNYVDKVTGPQLLMQGLRDSSVPPNESKRWAQRMRELGKADLLDYVEYPDEDHSLNRYRATIRDMLVRINHFLNTRLRLDGPAAGAGASH